MLQLTPQHRILLAVEPIDFRVGIDGLKATCQRMLSADPFSGTVFAFRSKSGVSVKLLVYDGSGFWLCQKRFSQGKLSFWPTSADAGIPLRASEVLVILAQGNPNHVAIPSDWRSV